MERRTRLRELLAFCSVLILSASTLAAPSVATAPAEPEEPLGVDRLYRHLEREGGERWRSIAVRALSQCEEILRWLPLERLADARIAGREIVLDFDFGGRDAQRVRIPPREYWVLEPDDEADPLRAGRVERVLSEERTLIVHERVRLVLGQDGFERVRTGDLAVAWGPFDFDLEVVLERRPGRIARDERGRVVLHATGDGRPERVDGRFVARTYDLWLVLVVRGRRHEIGVGPAGVCAERACGTTAVPRDA